MNHNSGTMKVLGAAHDVNSLKNHFLDDYGAVLVKQN